MYLTKAWYVNARYLSDNINSTLPAKELQSPHHWYSHSAIREACVANISKMIQEERIIWMQDGTLEDWKTTMANGAYGDHYCLQIFANLTCRDIIVIPVHESSAHIHQHIKIESDSWKQGNEPGS